MSINNRELNIIKQNSPKYNNWSDKILNIGVQNKQVLKNLGFTDKELEAVLKHEEGHRKDGWLYYTFFLMVGLSLLEVWWIFLRDSIFIISGPIIVLCYILFFIIFKRYLEFRADNFAKQKGYGKDLISFLEKAKAKTGNEFANCFHPSISSRVSKLRR